MAGQGLSAARAAPAAGLPAGRLGFLPGVADAIALRLRHHDGYLHRHWLPAPPVARLVFELLEQLRVESLVPAHQPGSRRNLHHRFSAWSNRFLASGQTESHLGLLLFSLSMMSWVQLGGGPIDEGTEHLIESTRMFLLREIGQPFGRIRRHREEQAAFAEQAQAIALTVNELVDDLQQQLADGEQDKEALEQVGKALACCWISTVTATKVAARPVALSPDSVTVKPPIACSPITLTRSGRQTKRCVPNCWSGCVSSWTCAFASRASTSTA
ncbi:hypothetical protein MBH78_02935 [Oceanimonas sp. NS1]|nr:hypothetical protein [Oceanimonas sp. NS1]